MKLLGDITRGVLQDAWRAKKTRGAGGLCAPGEFRGDTNTITRTTTGDPANGQREPLARDEALEGAQSAAFMNRVGPVTVSGDDEAARSASPRAEMVTPRGLARAK